MRNCKYIRINKPITETSFTLSWEILLSAADSDFISYLILANYNLDISPSIWLSQQAVEKYMKCLFLKEDSSFNAKKYNHDIVKLWKDTKKAFPKEILLKNKDYDDFIEELSTVNVNSRYALFNMEIERVLFSGKLIEFCDSMRKLILDKEYSSREFMGLADTMLTKDAQKIIYPIMLTYGSSLIRR